MQSITPSHAHPISGDFLYNYRNQASLLIPSSNSKVALACKGFQKLQYLAMQAMWKQEMARQVEVDSHPLDITLLSQEQLSEHEKEKRVNNRLRERMLAITATTTLETDVTACYRKLFIAQKKIVYGCTVKSKIASFKAVQQNYDSSFSFKRFKKNEELIDEIALERDRNLEFAWRQISRMLSVALPNPLTMAEEIRVWMCNKEKEEALVAEVSPLDLQSMNLSAMPEEIGLLRELDCLRLSLNHLSDLPTQLGHLTNLSSLYLDHNQFISIPSSIGMMADLRILNLSNNQITRVSPVIGQLLNLQSLKLSCNQISDLPQELGQLSRLESLELYSCNLFHLPSVVGRLINLRRLGLSQNQIQSLPLELSYLTHLEYLFLARNLLIQIPPFMGALTRLQKLDLFNNQISDLPIEFGSLSHLRKLMLSNNQFADVPPVIGMLTNLQTLDLYHNQIRDLPIELRHLEGLEVLNLSFNQFSRVPAVIGMLPRLVSLNLFTNQIDVLPNFLTNPIQPRLGVECLENPVRTIEGLVGNHIRGINMDRVEEIGVPFHEWFESHCTLSPLTSYPLAYFVNPLISCINTIMREIIRPVMSFFRGLLDYPSTIQMRLR